MAQFFHGILPLDYECEGHDSFKKEIGRPEDPNQYINQICVVAIKGANKSCCCFALILQFFCESGHQVCMEASLPIKFNPQESFFKFKFCQRPDITVVPVHLPINSQSTFRKKIGLHSHHVV